MYGNPLFRYWWTVAQKGRQKQGALFKRLASASGGAARPCCSAGSLSQEGTNEVTGPIGGGFLVVVIANISPLLLACTVCLHAALGTSLFLSFTLA